MDDNNGLGRAGIYTSYKSFKPEYLSFFTISKTFDWILLVEGDTDISFYSKFIKTMKILPEYEELSKEEESLKEYKEKLRADIESPLKEAPGKESKKKMIHLISIKTRGNFNFYGIMDADYNREDCEKLLKKKNVTDKIKITDAHSLEPMLLKYAGIDFFSNILMNIWPILSLDNAKEIVRCAKEFATKTGLARKNAINRQTGTGDPNTVLDPKFLRAEGNSFKFNLKDYLKELFKTETGSGWERRIDNEYNLIKDDDNHVYDVMHGHDFIWLVIWLKELNQNDKDFTTDIRSMYKITYAIIEKFGEKWFSKSEIYKWLREDIKLLLEKNRIEGLGIYPVCPLLNAKKNDKKKRYQTKSPHGMYMGGIP